MRPAFGRKNICSLRDLRVLTRSRSPLGRTRLKKLKLLQDAIDIPNKPVSRMRGFLRLKSEALFRRLIQSGASRTLSDLAPDGS
jgi:hypothetical protein